MGNNPSSPSQALRFLPSEVKKHGCFPFFQFSLCLRLERTTFESKPSFLVAAKSCVFFWLPFQRPPSPEELHQAQICTDAVLLSLLRADSTCPSGAAVCAAAFPRRWAPKEARGNFCWADVTWIPAMRFLGFLVVFSLFFSF